MTQALVKSSAVAKFFLPKKWDGLKHYAMASTWVSSAFILIILGTLMFQSSPALLTEDLNLFSVNWDTHNGQYGILPMVFGTLIVMFIAMAIALPLGILSAIYIAETRSDRLRRIFKSALEVLAGIPSIVYGLIGVAYLSLWVADGFELQTGRVILTAGLLLALMILPTLGETMAVMLVIGSLDRLPAPLFNVLSSSQTITSKLGREIAESAFGSTHFSVLVFMSLLLVSFTLILTIAAQKLLDKEPYRV